MNKCHGCMKKRFNCGRFCSNVKSSNKQLKVSVILGLFFVGLIVQVMLGATVFGCAALGKKDESPRQQPFYYNEGPQRGYITYEVCMYSSEEHALVSTWNWSGNPDENVITISDKTPDGAEINAVGGEGPLGQRMPFTLTNKDKEHDYCQTDMFLGSAAYKNPYNGQKDPSFFGIPEQTEAHFETIVFTMKLSKNVDRILIDDSSNFFCVINEDQSITVYSYYFYFECDPDNPFFYSKDGRLYEKESDSEVCANVVSPG